MCVTLLCFMTSTPACPVSPGTHICLSFHSGCPWGSGVFRGCQERGPQPKAHTVCGIHGLKRAMEGREELQLAEESRAGKLTQRTEERRTCSKRFASRPLFSGFEVSVLGIEPPKLSGTPASASPHHIQCLSPITSSFPLLKSAAFP